jgi:DNA-binding NarL/FixJ family response regulator
LLYAHHDRGSAASMVIVVRLMSATRRPTEPCAHHDRATRVLVLTTYGLDSYVVEALRSGASGFLLKVALPSDLLTAIRVVADGDALLDPKVTRG